jgi:predicted secreted protein
MTAIRRQRDLPGKATAGEWRALLAPMTVAGNAENIKGYLVVTIDQAGNAELHTNAPDDEALRLVLDAVRP